MMFLTQGTLCLIDGQKHRRAVYPLLVLAQRCQDQTDVTCRCARDEVRYAGNQESVDEPVR